MKTKLMAVMMGVAAAWSAGWVETSVFASPERCRTDVVSMEG